MAETRIPLTRMCSKCGHVETDPEVASSGDGSFRYAVDFKRVSGKGLLDHWGWIGKAPGVGAAFNAALDALIEAMPQSSTEFQVSRILNLSLPMGG
jgi:hypothetical protein